MKEILIWTLISGLLFLGFIITLIFGLVRKRLKVILLSIGIFVFVIGSALNTAYLLASKSYNRVMPMLKPRTGEEIYSALFGRTDNKCLKVLNYQDQVVPKIDYAIWLHFKTCPAEVSRILKQHEFQIRNGSPSDLRVEGPLADNNWFKPETLGDSILIFTYKKDEYGNEQTIYSSFDSAEAFCIDILD